MSFPMSCFRDLRVDASLFVMLAIHVATMTISVQLQYKEPVFTALIGIVYGPILAMTILIVSNVLIGNHASVHLACDNHD